MALELWNTGDLYQVLRDDRMDPIPSYFLDTFFRERHYSDDKEIHFSKLPAAFRKMAPFVLPTEQGKPIFGRQGEKVRSFTPAYIKPKDAVRPEDARSVLPSEVFNNGGQRPSLAERFDNRVIEIQEFHRRAIMIQWAWMAARSFIDGKLTINYGRDSGMPNPEVTIDFGRDPDLDIVLDTSFWDDPEHDIIGDISEWSNLMYGKPHGGRPRQLVVGADVAPCIQRNKGILALLSTQIRGGEGTVMQRGLMNVDEPLSYVATISGIGQAIEIWTYKDQVQNDDGSMVEILDPAEVLLIAPGANGVLAFGAIYDADAIEEGSVAVDIYPKMFKSDDPGEVFVMNQSAPLTIPLYPNRTLRARVLRAQ